MNIPITKKQFRLLQDILERVNDCLLYDKDMKSFVEDDFVLTLSVSDKANLTKALSNFYDRKETV